MPPDICACVCAAISVLKDREPGCFIVRDSHSFRGAYGLAMKVATPPPSVLQQSKKGIADFKKSFVQHMLECLPVNSRQIQNFFRRVLCLGSLQLFRHLLHLWFLIVERDSWRVTVVGAVAAQQEGSGFHPLTLPCVCLCECLFVLVLNRWLMSRVYRAFSSCRSLGAWAEEEASVENGWMDEIVDQSCPPSTDHIFSIHWNIFFMLEIFFFSISWL